MIYVPNDLPYSGCYVLQSNYVLRVYERAPTQNSSVNYIDVALDNHYIYREGIATFNQYSTLPTCIESDRITHAWSYRTDFFEVLGCIGIITAIVGFVLIKLVKLLFRGWF